MGHDIRPAIAQCRSGRCSREAVARLRSVTNAPNDSPRSRFLRNVFEGFAAARPPRVKARRANSKRNAFSRLPSEDILRLFFRVHDHHAAPMPFLHAEIDLAPEHLEIVDRRSTALSTTSHSNANSERFQRRMVRGQNHRAAGHHLQDHFRFAERRRRESPILPPKRFHAGPSR